MNSLELQKQELGAAMQAENVKAMLYENKAHISTFYKQSTETTIDVLETRDQLFEYFIDKVFIALD
jgi:hypothetical protein ELI_2926